MSRTERMTLDWEYFRETGKFRMVESTYNAECGCKQCRSGKSFYKRLDSKKSRQEGKALVCYEMTYPDVENGEPREVLQDRRGYTSVDYWYFENFIMPEWYEAQDWHMQNRVEGKYTTQSEGFDNLNRNG